MKTARIDQVSFSAWNMAMRCFRTGSFSTLPRDEQKALPGKRATKNGGGSCSGSSCGGGRGSGLADLPRSRIPSPSLAVKTKRIASTRRWPGWGGGNVPVVSGRERRQRWPGADTAKFSPPLLLCPPERGQRAEGPSHLAGGDPREFAGTSRSWRRRVAASATVVGPSALCPRSGEQEFGASALSPTMACRDSTGGRNYPSPGGPSTDEVQRLCSQP